MIHITGPALAILLVVGYLGIDAIVDKVKGLFGKDDENKK